MIQRECRLNLLYVKISLDRHAAHAPWRCIFYASESTRIQQASIQYQFLHLDYRTELEDDVIGAYQQSRATVYDVRLITSGTSDNTLSSYRQFALIAFVKASDGKWYFDPENDLILDLIEVIEE
jgi:hypothetical protein